MAKKDCPTCDDKTRAAVIAHHAEMLGVKPMERVPGVYIGPYTPPTEAELAEIARFEAVPGRVEVRPAELELETPGLEYPAPMPLPQPTPSPEPMPLPQPTPPAQPQPIPLPSDNPFLHHPIQPISTYQPTRPIQDPNDPTTQYLPPINHAPWSEPGTGGMFQQDVPVGEEKDGEEEDSEKEIEDRIQRKTASVPVVYEGYAVMDRPRVGQDWLDDKEAFDKYWDEDGYIGPPRNPDRISCPSRWRYKTEIDWETERVIGSDEDKQTAEALALGAAGAVSIRDRYDDAVESGALAAKIKEHLEDELNWKCDPECHLVVTIVAMHYKLEISYQLRLMVNTETGESRWDVVEVMDHTLRAIFDVECVE